MSNPVRALAEVFDTVSLGAPERAIGFVLWRVVLRYQREADRVLAAVDLTHLQFTTLAMAGYLRKSGETVSQSRLAQASAIHPMQVSLMLKTLEEKRFVRRRSRRTDTRVKEVEITARGVSALRAAFPLMIAVQERLFGPGGRPGGELLATIVALDEGGQEENAPSDPPPRRRR